jgi:hypothetical protein
MSEQELRLECLRLAVAEASISGGDPVKLADEFFAFICNKVTAE